MIAQKRYEHGKKQREKKEGYKSNKNDKHFIFRSINESDIVKKDTKMTWIIEKYYSHLVTDKMPEEAVYSVPSIFLMAVVLTVAIRLQISTVSLRVQEV